MPLKSIFCPADFWDFFTAACAYAASLAQSYGARVVALHVAELWKYPFADHAAREAGYGKFSPALNEAGEVRLREFVEKHSAAGVQPEIVVHQGDAFNGIPSFAKKKRMEGIGMGTHGRRGFHRLVLGSSIDRVLDKATCPVLVVSNPSHPALVTGPYGRDRLRRILYCTDFSHDSGASGWLRDFVGRGE